ncbi:MAG: Asp-tRNA(Asn)/Glu-tRNA(Gln) amidotransferase subunit GatB [Phycisphaerales bacterium]
MTATANAAVRSVRLKVGLEIHVELSTRTKMFTRAGSPGNPEFYDRPPNSLVTPVVAALPGTLPVMNRRAVEMSMMVGLALGCQVARFSKWDRKNYYYPDLPKGYQISQYDLPLCHDGAVEIPAAAGGTRRIGIIRAHLEEDTGKLGHELPGGLRYEGSLVDLNRAGTPLLEIVTAPDFDDAADVVRFAQELRNICRFLGVSEGIMQKGHMRFEPNINLHVELEDGTVVKTPVVEVKNLNSFKALRGAIDYEMGAQVERWRGDGKVMGPGAKSTRGWDDAKQCTVLQREKEDAHDYRYFPDPDLVPVVVDDAWLDRVRSQLGELPLARRARFEAEYGLEAKDAAALVEERDTCFFFEACVAALGGGRDRGYAAGKFLLNQLSKRANEQGVGVHEAGLSPAQVAGVLALRESGALGAQNVDALVGHLAGTADEPKAAAERHGLLVVRDDAALDGWIEQAIAANAQAAADVRAGKNAAVGRLVGAVMKLAGGRTDAKTVNERILAKLQGGAS